MHVCTAQMRARMHGAGEQCSQPTRHTLPLRHAWCMRRRELPVAGRAQGHTRSCARTHAHMLAATQPLKRIWQHARDYCPSEAARLEAVIECLEPAAGTASTTGRISSAQLQANASDVDPAPLIRVFDTRRVGTSAKLTAEDERYHACHAHICARMRTYMHIRTRSLTVTGIRRAALRS